MVTILNKLQKNFLFEKIIFVGDKGFIGNKVMQEVYFAGIEKMIAFKISKLAAE